MKQLIAINGKTFDPQEACVSALDRGLLFGDGVFEVFVGFGDKILNIHEHLDRLEESADKILLTLPWRREELAFELEHLISQVESKKKYVRLLVTRGNGLGLDIDTNSQPTKIMYVFPAPLEPLATYNEGISLKTFAYSSVERGAKAKTANYLDSIVALSAAKKQGYQDVLWLNPSDEIAEASTANIFFIARRGDEVEILTPSLQTGILSGITRQTIIRLLKQAKIPVHEEIIPIEELARFDEAFVCSTVRGLVPVRRINSKEFFTTRTHATFHHIHRLYITWVQTQIGYRPDWRTGLEA